MPHWKNLTRSADHKIFAGVCAGLAEWMGWDRMFVRIIFIIGSILPIIPGFVVYLILWLVLPVRKDRAMNKS